MPLLLGRWCSARAIAVRLQDLNYESAYCQAILLRAHSALVSMLVALSKQQSL